MTKAQRDIKRKLRVLSHGKESKNVSKTCRYFGISRDTYYRWKRNYERFGDDGLVDSKPCPENPSIRVSRDIEEKVIHLRAKYHFGPMRISWYLKRYHEMSVSPGGVRGVLLRYQMNRLPANSRKRSIVSTRYQKQTPGHHVQVDVKFLSFKAKNGSKVKRFQYTAIDDATRIRALKVYAAHTQANAIDFVNYVIEKFPFRIKCMRTDNGHEFQAKFHWHVEDLGIIHHYIKPGTPKHNGKVERSHRSDKEEFYQLLSYTGDRNLKKQLQEWEKYYNFHRPHAAFKGKTPFEILQSKLSLAK